LPTSALHAIAASPVNVDNLTGSAARVV
jgi:hypothetical protein